MHPLETADPSDVAAASPPVRTSSRAAWPRRALLAIVAGAALYAGHPPLDLAWVGLVALAPLIALARDVAAGPRPLRTGAAWGFLAGAVFFGALVEWVRLVDWIGVGLLVVTQGAFVAAFVAGLAWWGRRPAWPLVAALWWVGLEAVRGAVPYGGFAWGLLGYTQHDGPLLIVARTLGVLGVSLALAAVAAAVEETAHRLARSPRSAWVPLAAGGGVIAVAAALTLVPAPAPEPGTVDVAAVQGFDRQGSTGRSLPRALRIAEGHVETTQTLRDEPPPDLLVWPENALDSDPAEVPALAEAVAAAREAVGGAPLVTGVIGDGPTADTWENRMVVYDDGAPVPRDVYVKRQPVPFGEFIPLRPLIGWYPPIRQLRPTDAVAGTEPGVLDAGVDGVRIGAVICYESAFARLAHSQVREGANLLVVATNNSSFGRTVMSEQHVAFSSLRAVETGRWVVHAALSGQSAVVDPDGLVLERTGLFDQTVLRADVELVEGRTLATTVGDGVGWAGLVVALGGFAGARWHDRRSRPST